MGNKNPDQTHGQVVPVVKSTDEVSFPLAGDTTGAVKVSTRAGMGAEVVTSSLGAGTGSDAAFSRLGLLVRYLIDLVKAGGAGDLTAMYALLAILDTNIGDPTADTIKDLTLKLGNLKRSLYVVLGTRWDAAGDLGTDILDILSQIADVLIDLTPTEGTLATDGNEQVLIELDYSASPKIADVRGYLDFTAHTGTETVIIRRYVQIKAAGGYILNGSSTYTGVQSPLLLTILKAKFRYKLKLTIQKTAGTNRSYDYQFFTRRQA